jgi:hypothetical protein
MTLLHHQENRPLEKRRTYLAENPFWYLTNSHICLELIAQNETITVEFLFKSRSAVDDRHRKMHITAVHSVPCATPSWHNQKTGSQLRQVWSENKRNQKCSPDFMIITDVQWQISFNKFLDEQELLLSSEKSSCLCSHCLVDFFQLGA